MVGVDAATYGLFTGRLDAAFDWGTATAAGQLGSSVAGADGRWLRADLGLVAGRRVGEIAARGSISAFGLHYYDPFSYDAFGAEIRPVLSAWAGDFVISALPMATVGQWSTDALQGSLAAVGGDIRLERMVGPVTAAVSAGALNVANGVTTGAFLRGGAEARYTRGRWAASARLEGQRTPLETELGGGATLAGMLRPGVQLRLDAGRRVRDLLFGTEGTLALSAGLAVRPVRWSPPLPPPLVAVGEPEPGGRRVTFTLDVRDAREVALIGDFTSWEPLAMTRTRDGWRLERVLPPGLHHFGFIVDGVWAMPADAPGLVDDGWGQKNASVVVEP